MATTQVVFIVRITVYFRVHHGPATMTSTLGRHLWAYHPALSLRIRGYHRCIPWGFSVNHNGFKMIKIS